MGRMLTASGVMTAMWRLADDAGEAIEAQDNLKLVEPEPSEYVSPPNGVRAKLRLSGISEVFEMPSQFSESGTSKNIRVEFLVLKASGGGNAAQAATGRRFTALYTPTVGPKSNLGKLLSRLRERDIERGEEIDIDAFIGTEFVAPIVVNEKGYASIIPETIERGKTTLSPLLNGHAPAAAVAQTQAPQSDAGDAADADPFESEDDL